jgi:hypothetical protein
MADFNPNPRTDPTVVTQQMRGPENLNQARVVVDMEDTILTYLPQAQPLLTLTGRMRDKRQATNVRYDWLEKDTLPRVVDVTAAATAAAAAILIVAGQEAYGAIGYVFKNLRTNEQFMVGGVAAGTFTVLTRGIGGGAAPMNIGDKCLFLRAVYEDGAGLGTPKSIQEANLFNYTECIRTPFGFTGRDLATELYGGKDEMTETKWQAIEHKKSIELAMWFGKRALTTVTHQRTFMGGVDQAIATNVWNVSGTDINYRTINEALEYGMKWGKGGNLARGSGTKYLFASSRWITVFNDLAISKSNFTTTPLDKQIGFECFKYVSPHGTIMVLPTPLFDENHPDLAYLLDLNHLRYVYLRGRDTKLFYDRQNNDVDGRINEYMSDVGLQVEFEHAHMKWLGISI